MGVGVLEAGIAIGLRGLMWMCTRDVPSRKTLHSRERVVLSFFFFEDIAVHQRDGSGVQEVCKLPGIAYTRHLIGVHAA